MQEVILVCNRKFDWLKSQKEISESLLIKHKLDEATSRNIYADLKLFGCEWKSKLEKTKIKNSRFYGKETILLHLIAEQFQLKRMVIVFSGVWPRLS